MARKPVLVVLFALVILLGTGLSGVHAVALATAEGTRPLWHAVPPLVPLPASPSPLPSPPGPVSVVAVGDLAAGVTVPEQARALLRGDVVTGGRDDVMPDTTKPQIIRGYGESPEITEVRGVRVAVLGFTGGAVTDLTAAKRAVTAAAGGADLVVVHARLGAPGRYRTRPGTERHRGEHRGDPVRFAHAVVDAGADLVLGHGTGVLRGTEFYRGRLIAYSLGTFTAGGARGGRFATAGVLRVTLRPDGTWAGGTFTATRLDRAGRPAPDRTGAGLRQLRELSDADFPASGPTIGGTGRLTAR